MGPSLQALFRGAAGKGSRERRGSLLSQAGSPVSDEDVLRLATYLPLGVKVIRDLEIELLHLAGGDPHGELAAPYAAEATLNAPSQPKLDAHVEALGLLSSKTTCPLQDYNPPYRALYELPCSFGEGTPSRLFSVLFCMALSPQP